MNKEILVKISDFKQFKYCMRGVRTFMERHEIPWEEVRDVGVSTIRLKATGDAMAIAVAEWVENGKP